MNTCIHVFVYLCAYVETYSKHVSYAYYSGQAVMALVGRFHIKCDLIVKNIYYSLRLHYTDTLCYV